MTPETPQDHTSASLQQDVSTGARAKRPGHGNLYTPNPSGGYVFTAAARSTSMCKATWFNYFPSPDSAHGLTMADILSGLKLTVDTTEVTLTAAGHTTVADVLAQLAIDINASVQNVSASWHPGLTRFKLEKTDGTEFRVAVGTTGGTASLNQGLLTLLQDSTATISTSSTPAPTSHNDAISFQSPWPADSVTLNGVTLDSEGTDTLQGRLDAINAASSRTGVQAFGEPARLELTMAFSDTQSAETFERTSVSVNGIEATLGAFEPGDTETDVLGSLCDRMNHALTQGNLAHIMASLVDDTLIIECADLHHSVEVHVGSPLNTALINEGGGARFAAPSIRLESQTSAPIQMTSPYGAASAPGDPTLHTPTGPGDLPVRTLPGGLLEGEAAPGLTQNETAPRGRGAINPYGARARPPEDSQDAENNTLLDFFA